MKRSVSSACAQRGFSIVTLLVLAALIGGLGAVTVQVVPTVIEYQAIKRAVVKASEAGTVPDARMAFDKAVQIDQINGLSGKDLDIQPSGDRLSVRVDYQREVALFGPAYLTLKYSARSR